MVNHFNSLHRQKSGLQNSVPQRSGIKPQPNMPLVQESLDLLFDKRCLIMGFSTKPVSVATLQSTFLCRSADPSLDVLKDGLYDLFWLVKSHVISQRGNVKARITTRTCHQSRARDLYPQ